MDELERDRLSGVYAAMIGSKVNKIKLLKGGRNSRVYLLQSAKGLVVGKEYLTTRTDPRRRLETEWLAINLLREHHITCVPEPLAVDLAKQLAVFSYIEGEPVSKNQPTERDILEACLFLSDLKKLSEIVDQETLPAASEACFSIKDLLINLEERYDKLSGIPNEMLSAHLKSELIPVYNAVTFTLKAHLNREELTNYLPAEHCTLSPSDFGFHNAKRSTAGQMYFFDFEYFGWDDPVKTVSDFFLHPAMLLSHEHKRLFYENIFSTFAASPDFSRRLKLLYPLYALKWCFILLNEFLPEKLNRRLFSGLNDVLIEDLYLEQINKSKDMLRRVAEADEELSFVQ